MSYSVYVIKNSATGKIYIGQTDNLTKRIERHNDLCFNKASSHTHRNKGSGEWQLVYNEDYPSRNEAIVREKQLKTSRGRNFIHNIVNNIRP